MIGKQQKMRLANGPAAQSGVASPPDKRKVDVGKKKDINKKTCQIFCGTLERSLAGSAKYRKAYILPAFVSSTSSFRLTHQASLRWVRFRPAPAGGVQLSIVSSRISYVSVFKVAHYCYYLPLSSTRALALRGSTSGSLYIR